MDKNYDIRTITLKCKNMSKVSINSGASSSTSSSSSSSSACSTNMTSGKANKKMLRINEYDFSIVGYCPAYICNLNVTSAAYKFGLRDNDYIIKINDVNCCRATLKSIRRLITKTSTSINDQKYLVLTVQRRRVLSLVNEPKNEFICVNDEEDLESLLETKTASKAKKFKLSTLFKSAMPRSCLTGLDTTVSTEFYYQLEPTKAANEGSTNSNVLQQQQNIGSISLVDTSIETVLDTTNSYSSYDLTISEKYIKDERPKINHNRINLIGHLIDTEIEFVDFLSSGVSTFSRPLRGFFIRQNDYFILFQNIEKLLVISENVLQSLQKWSAHDIYENIGLLYNNKVKLLNDALNTYLMGYESSKLLLNDLLKNSKKFRSFLIETETTKLTLNKFLDMPISHFKNIISLLKRIKCLTTANTSEYANIENTINELKHLSNENYGLLSAAAAATASTREVILSTTVATSSDDYSSSNHDDDDDDYDSLTSEEDNTTIITSAGAVTNYYYDHKQQKRQIQFL